MRHLTRRQFIASAGLTGAGVALYGCANDSPTAGGHEPQIVNLAVETTGVDTADGAGELLEVTIVGQELTFDVTQLDATAGQEITITFDNRDAGVPHDFHVTGPGVDTATEIEVGPIVQTLTLTLIEPGEYTYICDVHPGTMRGTIVVTG